MAIKVTIKSANSIKLVASTSSVYQTTVTDQHSTNILCQCTNTSATRCTAEYLKNNSGKKSKNSLVIELTYYSGNTFIGSQEVIAMAGDGKITSVQWGTGLSGSTITGQFNENSSAIDCTNKTLYVKVTQSGTSNGHNTITELTSFNYYVSAHGHKTSVNTPTDATNLGSFNNKIKVFHRQSEIKYNATNFSRGWDATKLTACVPGKYSSFTQNGQTFYKLDNNVYPTQFSFTPPKKSNGDFDKPNYYVVIAYKNYIKGIGHMQIIDGQANSFIYKTNYWGYYYNNNTWSSGGWQYGGLRYTVYAIYDDGVSPSFATDYPKGYNFDSNQNKAEEYAQHVYFDYPERIVTVRWYDYNNGNPKLLKDGTNTQDLIYSIRYSTSKTPISVPDVGNLYNSKEKRIKCYYQGTSGTSFNTTEHDKAWFNNNVIPNKDLYFAVVFENIPYTITYKSDESNNNSSFTAYYSSTITIDPVGNARQLQSGATVKHKNPKTNGDEPAQYTITNIENNYTIQDPVQTGPEPLNLRFAYWEYSPSTNKLTAVWVPITVQIIYNPNGGNGSQQSRTAAYKVNYTILHPRDVGFSGSQAKPIFVSWNTKADGSGNSYTPGQIIKPEKSMTLFAIWGSPWKKVEWIWVYEPDKPDGTKDDHGWKRHKPWINTK